MPLWSSTKEKGWLSSDRQPFDSIPFTGKCFQCWFHFPLYLPRYNIFVSLLPYFQWTWFSHPLLLHIHLMLLGEVFSGKAGKFTQRLYNMWNRLLRIHPTEFLLKHCIEFTVYGSSISDLPSFISAAAAAAAFGNDENPYRDMPTTCPSVACSVQCYYSHKQVLRAATFLTLTFCRFCFLFVFVLFFSFYVSTSNFLLLIILFLL